MLPHILCIEPNSHQHEEEHDMRVSKKTMLAAGLIAGAAAMTGCSATTAPVATPTPKAAQQITAQPATAQPTAETSPEATMEAGEETPAPLSLIIDGDDQDAKAIEEDGRLLLPLEETADALGYTVKTEKSQEEDGEKRTVTLDKDESRITVSWSVSDNTVRNISWQKDGLLIPVNTRLTTRDDIVYVPAAFFEEAMDVYVEKTEKGVEITMPEPKDTPETQTQDIGENG